MSNDKEQKKSIVAMQARVSVIKTALLHLMSDLLVKLDKPVDRAIDMRETMLSKIDDIKPTPGMEDFHQQLSEEADRFYEQLEDNVRRKDDDV
ncbi:MAG: hypothetical protein AAGC95_08915 [Pseudomonadota bacterium]